jgi:flagellar assembly protein FliH
MGRILRISDDSRLNPAQFENFSERPVNFFREIVHDQPKSLKTPLGESNFALRVPASEKRRHAADIERARLEGIEQGKAVGREAAQQELAPALELMQNYATMLAAERADLASHFESQLIALATQMAERILNVELSVKPELLSEIVKNAFRSLGEAKQVTVRVHPKDLALLKERAQEIAQHLASSAVLDIRPDDTLGRGDCLVDSDIGSLDARLHTQLETLKQQLEISLGKTE